LIKQAPVNKLVPRDLATGGAVACRNVEILRLTLCSWLVGLVLCLMRIVRKTYKRSSSWRTDISRIRIKQISPTLGLGLRHGC